MISMTRDQLINKSDDIADADQGRAKRQQDQIDSTMQSQNLIDNILFWVRIVIECDVATRNGETIVECMHIKHLNTAYKKYDDWLAG